MKQVGSVAVLLILYLLTAQAAFSPPHCSVHSNPSTVCSDSQSEGDCLNLSDVLKGFRGQISPADCLELSLSPGVYQFGSKTVLDYSAVIVAPNGGVKITCEHDDENTGPFAFRKSEHQSEEMFVVIHGLWFHSCSWPLQFDNLDSITISTSTFR